MARNVRRLTTIELSGHRSRLCGAFFDKRTEHPANIMHKPVTARSPFQQRATTPSSTVMICRQPVLRNIYATASCQQQTASADLPYRVPASNLMLHREQSGGWFQTFEIQTFRSRAPHRHRPVTVSWYGVTAAMSGFIPATHANRPSAILAQFRLLPQCR